MATKEKVVELTNLKSGKTLRIHNSQIDAKGGHGPHAKLKIIKVSKGVIKIQSVNSPNEYIALGPKGGLKVGPGGQYCEFKVKKQDKQTLSLQSAHSEHVLAFDANGEFCGNKPEAAKKGCLFKIDKV